MMQRERHRQQAADDAPDPDGAIYRRSDEDKDVIDSAMT